MVGSFASILIQARSMMSIRRILVSWRMRDLLQRLCLMLLKTTGTTALSQPRSGRRLCARRFGRGLVCQRTNTLEYSRHWRRSRQQTRSGQAMPVSWCIPVRLLCRCTHRESGFIRQDIAPWGTRCPTPSAHALPGPTRRLLCWQGTAGLCSPCLS